MQLPDTIAFFEKYKPHLSCIFEHYAKLDNVEIELARLNLWQHKTMVKFGNQMKIIPFLLSADEINVLFKALSKEKGIVTKEAGLMLDYDGFLEALVRISIMGRKRLEGDENSPKLSKDKTKIFDMSSLKTEVTEELLRYMGINLEDKKNVLVQKLIDLQMDYTKAPMLVMVTKKPEDTKSQEGTPPQIRPSPKPQGKKDLKKASPTKPAKSTKPAENSNPGDKKEAEIPEVPIKDESKKEEINKTEVKREEKKIESGKQEEIIAPDGKKETWEVKKA